jgi:hypothetical protein
MPWPELFLMLGQPHIVIAPGQTRNLNMPLSFTAGIYLDMKYLERNSWSSGFSSSYTSRYSDYSGLNDV